MKITAAIVSAAVVAVPLVAALPASAVSPATTYCKRVIANDVREFTSPGGQDYTAVLANGSSYLVDRTDAPYNRYHVYGQNLWTTSDPAYVKPC